MRHMKEHKFQAYGLDADLPDPVLRAIDDLRHEVARLNGRIAELEGRSDENESPVRASGT
jgi:hypothetical protein